MNRSLTAHELREIFFCFFKQRGHTLISGGSLIPQNDPTVLFTTAGMHPLVPYLMGEPHPAGQRLCDVQKCIRTGDIDAVGNASHLTFFEMLGSWSLGDYFKEDAIAWSYEFLTSPDTLGFPPDALYVTVFQGNDRVPADRESAEVWKKMGIPEARILFLPVEDNWWGPAGRTGPCGPDTEMFIDIGQPPCGPACRPGCSCGKYFEIWNDVFMQYEKTAEGAYVPLKKNNVDTGMGVERTIAMLQGKKSVYETELFAPIIAAIAAQSGQAMGKSDVDGQVTRAFRVIADHLRSSVFILGDEQGVSPSNLGQGYVLRRLIRRAVRHAKNLEMSVGFVKLIAESVIAQYGPIYPELTHNRDRILRELAAEEEKFEKTLNQGLQEFGKVLEQMKAHNQKALAGRIAFRLYDTYGFPVEFTAELCAEQGITIDKDGFDKAFAKHQEISRQGADKVFKGGLADNSEATTRLHTATHLLHRSLQLVLGDHVKQKGSNITAERLRFDFSHSAKLTPEEIRKVETLVNDAIQKGLPVSVEVMTLEQAQAANATALFAAKYGEQVKVYSIGDFSREVCGGPHVDNIRELGRFRIQKEEASSAGVRRIRAVLEASC
ncbi:MAG: alanine--tRNA ligase [Verrucomicrobia bacterium]|nr:alanine--tRNA ligase [Verrucomicrobiota bacterium]MCG2680030.1 alanine--tRNA ligase [Kiritimatiellia bacterium]MBU4246966.1 alanine--tRNA ligase [Verrucomicrobiota bacterium]MBU4291326.1 alanine--tRNA ligase [Verrucomicrobiota bacterium]MBU4430445.1 alanine--tRNA ligase [Verrucomicrobiota bacterium]